jgi:hypothetical protein
MAEEKKGSERKESTIANPAKPAVVSPVRDNVPAREKTPPPQQPEQVKLALHVEGARTTYANLARVTGTPEEVILDLALNPNAFGQVLDESIQVDHRIVMSYAASKRLLMVLNEVIRRYEERFGHIEIDVARRVLS